MGQVYRHLLGERSLVPAQLEPWADSWVAIVDDEPVGVGLSQEDQVCDLWLLPGARGYRIGSRLLALLEGEISQRGFARARLRVVAENQMARDFYRTQGWCEADQFSHEKLGFPMLNLYKDLKEIEGESS